MGTGKNILSILAGGLVGAGIALLLAPKKGKDTRDDIAKGVNDFTANVTNETNKIKDNVSSKARNFQNKVQDAIHSKKKQTDDSLNDFKKSAEHQKDEVIDLSKDELERMDTEDFKTGIEVKA